MDDGGNLAHPHTLHLGSAAAAAPKQPTNAVPTALNTQDPSATQANTEAWTQYW